MQTHEFWHTWKRRTEEYSEMREGLHPPLQSWRCRQGARRPGMYMVIPRSWAGPSADNQHATGASTPQQQGRACCPHFEWTGMFFLWGQCKLLPSDWESSKWLDCIYDPLLRCLITQSCLTLCDPTDCNLPGSSVHVDSPGKNTRVGCHALLTEVATEKG